MCLLFAETDEDRDRQNKRPNPLMVYDCCGIFGWTIPWAAWKSYDPPILPTLDVKRYDVYIFSKKGQLSERDPSYPANIDVLSMPPQLNIDPFIVNDQMDWMKVREAILKKGYYNAGAQG